MVAPAHFRCVNFSKIRWAQIALETPIFTQKETKVKGAKAAGIKYEKHVQEVLCKISPLYVPSPWIHFSCFDEPRTRWCQPDGMFFDIKKGLITVVEIKYSHTQNAWWQLRRLYEPLLSYIFPRRLFAFALLEIVAWFDPQTSFPEKFYFAEDPLEVREDQIGVHIFSKGSRLSQKTAERLYA